MVLCEELGVFINIFVYDSYQHVFYLLLSGSGFQPGTKSSTSKVLNSRGTHYAAAVSVCFYDGCDSNKNYIYNDVMKRIILEYTFSHSVHSVLSSHLSKKLRLKCIKLNL
jgi:hypothetical protein